VLLEPSSLNGWHQHPGSAARSKVERRRQRRQDASLHQRQRDGSRERAHRWRHYSAEVVTSGRLNSDNFISIATWAQHMGDLGEDGPDRWDRAEMRSLTSGSADVRGPLGSDGGEGSGCGPASWWTGPNVVVALGRRGGKWPVKIFPF
jgi:hypothetical protein